MRFDKWYPSGMKRGIVQSESRHPSRNESRNSTFLASLLSDILMIKGLNSKFLRAILALPDDHVPFCKLQTVHKLRLLPNIQNLYQ